MKSSSDQDDVTHEVGIDVPAELHQRFSEPSSHSISTHSISTHSITTSTTLPMMASASQVGAR